MSGRCGTQSGGVGRRGVLVGIPAALAVLAGCGGEQKQADSRIITAAIDGPRTSITASALIVQVVQKDGILVLADRQGAVANPPVLALFSKGSTVVEDSAGTVTGVKLDGTHTIPLGRTGEFGHATIKADRWKDFTGAAAAAKKFGATEGTWLLGT